MTIKDQPPPVPNSTRPIWELVIADFDGPRDYDPQQKALADAVIADMRERDKVGRERYGTPLQANNGRDAVIDAYQEALDCCVYARQNIHEIELRGEKVDELDAEVYNHAVTLVMCLRAKLMNRN